MRPGQPSATAMLVAASVTMHGARHGLPAETIGLAERALALGAAHGSLVASLARHRTGRWLLTIVQMLVLPGLATHHCARKAWLWNCLRTCASQDSQLVWLGVGFDGLGRALLARGTRTHVVETDHADTLGQRRALVGEDGIEMKALALPDQLGALAALCALRPTTIICEGMLMYLPRRDVWRALKVLAALPRPPRLVFTALDTPLPGGRGFRRPTSLVRRWLARQGEPFRWRSHPRQVRASLGAFGYAVTQVWDGDGYGEYAIEAEPSSRR